MSLEKTNISARVEITLKKIVEESSFTHRDAYELGAMLIAIGDAQDTITLAICELSTTFHFEPFLVFFRVCSYVAKPDSLMQCIFPMKLCQQ